ncbi:MAG: hypothetical protein IJM08_04085 [Firmicutes bacterium]|nr:hypothetical protein [Bacillota bacterium]
MQFDFTIHTMKDLEDAVQEYGFLPYFCNSLRGFSIEEHVDPMVWFSDDREGVWEWKGPVIRETGCAYGKFFEKKAAFVSRDWFIDLANYRRDGYDYEGFFNDGLAPYKDKYLFELIEANGPLLSKDLKTIGGYGKNGRKGFDTSINRLQAQCFVLISDFKYMQDRFGNEYGWGVAEYATPEQFMGETHIASMYSRDPKESCERLTDHIRSLLPDSKAEDVKSFLK